MKANLKGLGGIKHLALAHGEKLVIAIVCVIAIMMFMKSLSREKLPADKQADRLQEQVTSANNIISEYTWSKLKEEHPEAIRTVVPLTHSVDDSLVKPADYQSPTQKLGWDPPVVPPTVLRTDPVLLEAQDLESDGGSGLLAFLDPAVRKQKMLEEQKQAQQAAKEQEKEMKRSQDEGERGGGRGRGGRDQGAYGGDVFDPAHPKRRPVVGIVQPKGVPLQDYEDIRVAHWAIVVAKVPVKEQLKLYRDVFENARGYNPATDLPQYLGYFVERAEIRSGDEEQDLKWEKVSVFDGKNTRPVGSVVSQDTLFGRPEEPMTRTPERPGVVTNWASQMPEIVDPRYLDGGALAFPLPPLVGRDWGREVTHSDIPLADDAVAEEQPSSPGEAKPDAKEAEPADLFSGGGRALGSAPGYGGARGYGGEGRGGMSMERSQYGGRGATYGGGGRGTSRGGMGMGGYDGMERGAGYGGRGGGRGLTAEGAPEVPHWLLRFFDFSVEPGKKYKYRVRLAMLDPNGLASSATLDSDVLSRIRQERKGRKATSTPFRLTEWSKPSRTVTIPLAGNVHVAAAKPATDGFNKEPSVKLLVESFGTDEQGNALQVAKEKDFQRGSVANMTEDAEKLVEQGRAIDPVDDFNFRTNITILDIRGGGRLTRKEQRPADVLLMGPAGQLFVQSELSDSEMVEAHRATFTKEAPDSGAAGFRGGPMYDGRGRGR